MERMRRLLDAANNHSYVVHFCGLPDDLLACTVPEMRRIFVDSRLTEDEQRGHLAHELGHLHTGDPCVKHPRTAAELARERRADRYAARLLIDPLTYARVEAINPDQHAIADELGIPVEYVHVFEQDCLTQVRGITYVHAKEGIGQWAHRGEVA
ncbi:MULTISPECIES: ImmA/IrrE family metallo-endopeptidase [Bacteria]|uniref:ImmA/IrrE family metallo-endopeptidase n=1 Tax=Bacteria TaxID=2 RepID=UPI003C7A68D5